MKGFTFTKSKIKSPCVPGCQDRSAECRTTCEKHKAYEAAKAAERESKPADPDKVATAYEVMTYQRLRRKRRNGK